MRIQSFSPSAEVDLSFKMLLRCSKSVRNQLEIRSELEEVGAAAAARID